ncbi:MAG: hypothetical protein GC149_14265 [Gammaproteobacteria bacterium]|nr:hypothetical protein [Gammaproteobacteria bacterium]
MSDMLHVMILGADLQSDDDGFRQALVAALQRAGVIVEEIGLAGKAGELLDRLEKNSLPIVLKPC